MLQPICWIPACLRSRRKRIRISDVVDRESGGIPCVCPDTTKAQAPKQVTGGSYEGVDGWGAIEAESEKLGRQNEFFSILAPYKSNTNAVGAEKHRIGRLRLPCKKKFFDALRNSRKAAEVEMKTRPLVSYLGHRHRKVLSIAAKATNKLSMGRAGRFLFGTVGDFVAETGRLGQGAMAAEFFVEGMEHITGDFADFFTKASASEAMVALVSLVEQEIERGFCYWAVRKRPLDKAQVVGHRERKSRRAGAENGHGENAHFSKTRPPLGKFWAMPLRMIIDIIKMDTKFCFMWTPYGVFQQTKGCPMGGPAGPPVCDLAGAAREVVFEENGENDSVMPKRYVGDKIAHFRVLAARNVAHRHFSDGFFGRQCQLIKDGGPTGEK